jgi:hypothetical protein
MSYEQALKAAGVTVHEFKEFGSYQGDWLAKVTLPDGRAGWIKDYFGSCSSCDAFEAEFGWSADEEPGYRDRLRAFGERYLDGLLTQEEAEAECAKDAEWSLEDAEMLEWLKSHR